MFIKNLNREESLIIYDGYCYLCSNTIRMISRLDHAKNIKFIQLEKALKDDQIKKLISIYKSADQIMLFSKNRMYIKTDAILMISKIVGGRFKIFKIMYILPKRYRDLIYDFIAKNRYRFFGKSAICHIPSAEFTDRYL